MAGNWISAEWTDQMRSRADLLGFGSGSADATAPFIGPFLVPEDAPPWLLLMAGVGVVAGTAYLGTLLDFRQR